jgi:flagellar basal body-associated protein FliL
MADEKLEEKPQENATEKPQEKKKGGSMLPWIIIASAIVVMAGAGLGLGLLFGRSSKPDIAAPAAASPAAAAPQPQPSAPAAGAVSDNIWYFDLEPVVANLNEPGATRYVRAVFTLEMSGEIAPDKGAALLEQKKPLLTNLMTIYLAGLNVEATRGDKNLKRIQSEICDTFNERLFPDSKPLIKKILIKEFAVQ